MRGARRALGDSSVKQGCKGKHDDVVMEGGVALSKSGTQQQPKYPHLTRYDGDSKPTYTGAVRA
jgi:hypothetical protein